MPPECPEPTINTSYCFLATWNPSLRAKICDRRTEQKNGGIYLLPVHRRQLEMAGSLRAFRPRWRIDRNGPDIVVSPVHKWPQIQIGLQRTSRFEHRFHNGIGVGLTQI